MSASATLDAPVLVIKDSTEFVKIRVLDGTGDLVDPFSLRMRLYSSGEALLVDQSEATPATPTADIVRVSEGVFAWPFGDTSIDEDNSSEATGTFYVHWTYELTDGGEPISSVQTIRVISLRTLAWTERLRALIDKAHKAVDEDPDDPCYLGYTPYMLVSYLEGGLSWINAFQPYPMWASIDLFPAIHWRLLVEAALVDAIMSQELFAVDTDINYSDQGNVFMIDHQPKLSAFVNSVWARLVQMVPLMKRHYVRSGSIRCEMGPNFRLQSMLNAAPSGTSFRNMFVSMG